MTSSTNSKTLTVTVREITKTLVVPVVASKTFTPSVTTSKTFEVKVS